MVGVKVVHFFCCNENMSWFLLAQIIGPHQIGLITHTDCNCSVNLLPEQPGGVLGFRWVKFVPKCDLNNYKNKNYMELYHEVVQLAICNIRIM